MLIQSENSGARWKLGRKLIEAGFSHIAEAGVVVASLGIVPVRHHHQVEAE